MKRVLHNRTIRRELFVFYLILIITFLIVTGIFTGFFLFNSMRESIFKDSAELSESIGNTVNIFINETNYSLLTMGELLETLLLNDSDNSAEIEKMMISYVKNHEELEKMKIVNREGVVEYIVPYSRAEIGNNLSQAQYIKNIDEEIYWSDVFLSPATGEPSVTVSYRLREYYIVIDISLNSLNLLLAEIKRNSEIIIYDSKGRAVASTNTEEVYHGVNHSNQEHVKKALLGNVITDDFLYQTGETEIEMLGTAIPLKNNWVVVVSKAISKALAPVGTTLMTVAFAGILTFFIGFLVFQLISKRIKDSIASLINWSEQLADGNYNNTFQINSYRELNQLADSFQRMSQNVENREIELNNQKMELNASNEELESYNEEMAAMNEELIDSEKRANDSNQAKSEFLANMSHELRTPLNGIMGFSQILKSSELTPEQSEYIDNVLYSSEHLLQIINDILDFSKIEAGKLVLERIDTDLRELLENTFTLNKPSADKKGLKAFMNIDSKIPVLVKTDPLRLSQVIINLLSNAVKFTERGEIGLEVYVLLEKKDRVRIRFVVFDSGIGIPEEKQMTIFDMFTQLDSSFTRKYGGTGLGLSISNKILDQMGSRMVIESEMNKGSVFSFELELEKADLKKPSNKDEEMADDIGMLSERNMTVLIVEDDLINSKLAKTIINNHLKGSKVCVAFDGQEGVEKFFKCKPELVLMDLHMPIKDGIEAVREIRAGEDEANRAVIIALSADVREDRIEESIQSGFDDYLKKPFNKRELFRTLLKNLY